MAAAGGVGTGIGTSAGGGWWSALASAFSGGWGGIAMGGAFGGGQRLDKFALGSVVSNPQFFMHGGRIGLMGEAGPEAIVPLHRGRDGKLGIRMAATSSAASPPPPVLNRTFVVQGTPDRRTREQIAFEAGREARRAMRRIG